MKTVVKKYSELTQDFFNGITLADLMNPQK